MIPCMTCMLFNVLTLKSLCFFKSPFKFTFHYRANPRQVTLRTAHNKYVSSEPNGVLSGSADAPNAWSLFELVSLGYVGFNNNIKL